MAQALTHPGSTSWQPSRRTRNACLLLLALVAALFLSAALHQAYGPIDPASVQSESLDWHGNSASRLASD